MSVTDQERLASNLRPVACEISDANVVFPVPGGP